MINKTIIEVKVNEELERKGQKFFFKYSWKKQVKNLRKIAIVAVLFLSLGFYPIKNFDQNLIYYILRYGGLLCAFQLLLTGILYYYSKKNFNKKVEQRIKDLRDNNVQRYSILLDDKNFEFQNSINNIGAIWEKTKYDFAEDYIILTLIDDIGFVFAKKEFEGNDYQVLTSFLEKYSNKIVQ